MYFDYIIAGLRLRTDIDLVGLGLKGFKPFVVEVEGDADCVITYNESIDIDSLRVGKPFDDTYVLEADADSTLSPTATGYLYRIQRRQPNSPIIYFHIERESGRVVTNIDVMDNVDLAIMRFGIWVMFGIVLVDHSAIAIHSSAIVKSGQCVLFLGESGTGKSTHTRLWRESIPGATLLNDDSPIIRICDDRLMIFGSPWSGKTPCYKRESYPVAGFCRIVQAPYNKINRLPALMAIGALLPSCPPMFAHDEYLQDRICKTLGDALHRVPTCRLECLPNSDAAHLSYSTFIHE